MEKEISVKRNEVDLFICSCHSTEHQMVVLYDEDEVEGRIYPTVFINTHLVKRPLWQRVKYGLKYIFGYQCRYGAFEEFILHQDDADKISKIAAYLNKHKD